MVALRVSPPPRVADVAPLSVPAPMAAGFPALLAAGPDAPGPAPEPRASDEPRDVVSVAGALAPDWFIYFDQMSLAPLTVSFACLDWF
jgi:hypothetical protein